MHIVRMPLTCAYYRIVDIRQVQILSCDIGQRREAQPFVFWSCRTRILKCVCVEWRHESRGREREKEMSENATLRHAARADGKSHLSHLQRKNRMNAIKSHLLDEDARARHVIGISVLMENRERYGRVNLAAMRKMKTVLAQVVVVFYLYGGKSTLDGCDDLSLGSWTTIECSSSVMSGFFGSTIHIARRPGSERLFLLLPLASLPSAEHLQEEHQNRLCDRPKCAPNNLLLG